MACFETARGQSLPSVDAAFDSAASEELCCAKAITAWDYESTTITWSFSGNAGWEAKGIGAPCFSDVGKSNVKGECCAAKHSSSVNSIFSVLYEAGEMAREHERTRDTERLRWVKFITSCTDSQSSPSVSSSRSEPAIDSTSSCLTKERSLLWDSCESDIVSSSIRVAVTNVSVSQTEGRVMPESLVSSLLSAIFLAEADILSPALEV